jgi:hypothetical protein
MPASTWDTNNQLPVETQGTFMTDVGTPVAATSEDVDWRLSRACYAKFCSTLACGSCRMAHVRQ